MHFRPLMSSHSRIYAFTVSSIEAHGSACTQNSFSYLTVSGRIFLNMAILLALTPTGAVFSILSRSGFVMHND
jgi:hypothetical protein